MEIDKLKILLKEQVFKEISLNYCINNALPEAPVVPILSDYGIESHPNYRSKTVTDETYEKDNPKFSLLVNPYWFYHNERLINAWAIDPRSSIARHTSMKVFGIDIDIANIEGIVNDPEKFNIIPLIDTIEANKEEVFEQKRNKNSLPMDLDKEYRMSNRITISTPQQQRNQAIGLYGAGITIKKSFEEYYSIDEIYLTQEERGNLEIAARDFGISSSLDRHIADIISDIITRRGFHYFEDVAASICSEETYEEEYSLIDVTVDVNEEIFEQLEMENEDE